MPVLLLGAQIDFGSESPHIVFLSSGLPKQLPALAEPKTERLSNLDTASAKPGDYVVAWDRDTNNIALRKVSQVAQGWVIRKEDFTRVGFVSLRIEHAGDPVAAAQVEVKDGEHGVSQILDPSLKGELKFFCFTPGELKVTVHYGSKGQQAEPLTQGFQLELKRSKVEPRFVVSIADPVETVSSPKTPTDNGKDAAKSDAPIIAPTKPVEPEKPKASEGGGIGNSILYLLVLGGLGYGGYLLYKKAQAQPGDLTDKLKSIGVPVAPEPPTNLDPGASVVPDNLPPPPPTKILLPDAAPAPISQTPVSSGTPTLRADSGASYVLQAGENVLGREDGLAISLVGESSVSRRHAALIVQGSQVTVRDLGSTNGTFVNGQKVTADIVLHLGDRVQFGAVAMRLEG
ncbi:MAG: FHA domain-containing protein [Armatimonadetes bacterium]|nr:FHA domain-containing protein [Armatimonadota bacterium]